jgi:hypothetical protein
VLIEKSLRSQCQLSQRQYVCNINSPNEIQPAKAPNSDPWCKTASLHPCQRFAELETGARERNFWSAHVGKLRARRPHRAQKFTAAPREFGWSLNGIDSRLRPGKTCSLALYLITSTISLHYGEREKREAPFHPSVHEMNRTRERGLISFFFFK